MTQTLSVYKLKSITHIFRYLLAIFRLLSCKKRHSEYQNSLLTFECDLLLRCISLQGVFAFIAILVLTKTSYMLLTIRCMHIEYSAFQVIWKNGYIEFHKQTQCCNRYFVCFLKGIGAVNSVLEATLFMGGKDSKSSKNAVGSLACE